MYYNSKISHTISLYRPYVNHLVIYSSSLLKTHLQSIRKPKNNHREQDNSLENVRCEACTGVVVELNQEVAEALRMKFTEESSVRQRAFVCLQCEVILYADEFMFGKFVPPTLRNYLEHESDCMKESYVPAGAPPQLELLVQATSRRKRSSTGNSLGQRRLEHNR